MKQSFVNGSTLLGTALTLFALSQSSIVTPFAWNWYIMIIGTLFFLISAIIEFYSFR